MHSRMLKLACKRGFRTSIAQRGFLYQSRRFLLIYPTTYLLESKNPDITTSKGQNDAKDEDSQELERERVLRERFARKIHQAIPRVSDENIDEKCRSTANSEPPNPFSRGFGSADAAASMLNFVLFSILIFLPLLLFLFHRVSFFEGQRLPWRELPIATVACYLLLRTLYPASVQRRVKDEYESTCRKNPYLSFDQFISQCYPDLFHGYRSSQAEVIAAVSACLVSANDLQFARTMLRAAGRAKDVRVSVDAILDALQKDFPNVF